MGAGAVAAATRILRDFLQDLTRRNYNVDLRHLAAATGAAPPEAVTLHSVLDKISRSRQYSDMADIDTEINRTRYPHMVPEEIAIWKRFLKKHGNKFDRYRYDVHVGKGSGPVAGYTKKEQDMFIRLTQKRIDVVAYRGRGAFIVEIKNRAGMSAIGQLTAYKRLYREEYGAFSVAGLAIVAESIDPDVKHVADTMGIQVVLV